MAAVSPPCRVGQWMVEVFGGTAATDATYTLFEVSVRRALDAWNVEAQWGATLWMECTSQLICAAVAACRAPEEASFVWRVLLTSLQRALTERCDVYTHAPSPPHPHQLCDVPDACVTIALLLGAQLATHWSSRVRVAPDGHEVTWTSSTPPPDDVETWGVPRTIDAVLDAYVQNSAVRVRRDERVRDDAITMMLAAHMFGVVMTTARVWNARAALEDALRAMLPSPNAEVVCCAVREDTMGAGGGVLCALQAALRVPCAFEVSIMSRDDDVMSLTLTPEPVTDLPPDMWDSFMERVCADNLGRTSLTTVGGVEAEVDSPPTATLTAHRDAAIAKLQNSSILS